MKKVLAAVAAGALLIAGQAVAAQTVAPGARVGDRVGARAEAASDFAGVPISLIAAGVLVVVIAVASDDDSDSD
ncbi:hypothetical protein [Brevundimonas sp. GCM10030266]|uniref:hypothetical protein n=1 Tax=Brevundimonas sp. GCM10030266 TaxID=3273386 RepID=UPI00361A98AB